MEIKKVGVVGCGVMGSDIVQVMMLDWNGEVCK
ncbi:hypothetical protein ES705_29250 [subsurface metagenome]